MASLSEGPGSAAAVYAVGDRVYSLLHVGDATAGLPPGSPGTVVELRRDVARVDFGGRVLDMRPAEITRVLETGVGVRVTAPFKSARASCCDAQLLEGDEGVVRVISPVFRSALVEFARFPQLCAVRPQDFYKLALREAVPASTVGTVALPGGPISAGQPSTALPPNRDQPGATTYTQADVEKRHGSVFGGMEGFVAAEEEEEDEGPDDHGAKGTEGRVLAPVPSMVTEGSQPSPEPAPEEGRAPAASTSSAALLPELTRVDAGHHRESELRKLLNEGQRREAALQQRIRELELRLAAPSSLEQLFTVEPAEPSVSAARETSGAELGGERCDDLDSDWLATLLANAATPSPRRPAMPCFGPRASRAFASGCGRAEVDLAAVASTRWAWPAI